MHRSPRPRRSGRPRAAAAAGTVRSATHIEHGVATADGKRGDEQRSPVRSRAATARDAAAAGGAAGGVHERWLRPAWGTARRPPVHRIRYGHIQDELQEQVNDPDETDDLLRLGLHRLPITQFPRLRSLATVLATYDGAAELDEGLAIVIAGLRSQLLT
jgi:hypothetical protein